MYPPKLKTNRYIIQAYRPEDEERFVEMALDEVSVRFMGGANGIETEERQLFKKVFEIYERKDKRWFWLWGIYKDNVLCGHLELKESPNTNLDELEIVYMVHPAARRQGLMTEVLLLLKNEQHNWERKIIATVSPKNTNSIALLEKWGIDKRKALTDPETGKEYLKLTLKRNTLDAV